MTLRPHGHRHRAAARPRLGALAVLVLGASALAACSSGDGADPTATTETTAPPTTAPEVLPAGAVAVALDDLAVGQCFLLPHDDPGAEDRAVWAVACDQPHTHEVLDVVDYDGDTDDGGHPGAATVQSWSEDACYERFEPFVGVPWTRSELDIEVWWPSEDSWDLDDRSVLCAVFPSDGRRTTGTARGSER